MNKVAACVLLVCVAGVLSAPTPQQQQQQQQQRQVRQDKEPIPITLLENDASVDGTYHYKFESGDGTKVEQDGQLKQVQDEEGKPAQGEVANGSYSYVGDDGQTYSVTYVADETGYHPQGAHLPVPPPIPEAIQRALDYLRTAPPPTE